MAAPVPAGGSSSRFGGPADGQASRILQYLLAGKTWIFVGVVLLSWYWGTAYWLDSVMWWWHPSFEYAWLLLIVLSITAAVWLVRRAIKREKLRHPVVPPPSGAKARLWVWDLRLDTVNCGSRIVRDRNRWIRSRLAKCGDQAQSLTFDQLPGVWLHQPGFWLRFLLVPLLVALLVSPFDFIVGEALASLWEWPANPAGEEQPHFLNAYVCPEPCSDKEWRRLPLEGWPGGTVAIGGTATIIPYAGRMRFELRNRPRTRRILKVSADPGCWLAIRDREKGSELEATVHGSKVEIRYAFADENTWDISLKLTYAKRLGRDLQTATLSAQREAGGTPLRQQD